MCAIEIEPSGTLSRLEQVSLGTDSSFSEQRIQEHVFAQPDLIPLDRIESGVGAVLSKSNIAMFEQCQKRLWLSAHRPELAQQDNSAETRFATDHQIRMLARALLPTGTMVAAGANPSEALETTRMLLEVRPERPIFEATLANDGVIVRIDILEPDGSGGWRMAAVKSSTSAKDYHLGEVATQLWVARAAGLPISCASIRHLDSSFVLERTGEFAGLFADTQMITAAEPVVAGRAAIVALARESFDRTGTTGHTGEAVQDAL